MPFGQALTLEQVWRLSQRWYGDRYSPDFEGRTAAEAQQIFHELGLDDPFWAFS